MAFQSATLHWDRVLSGGPSDEEIIRQSLTEGCSLAEAQGRAAAYPMTKGGFQDAITPKSQSLRNIVFTFAILAMLVLGIVYFRWYWGLVGFFGTFILTSILKSFLPGGDSSFFREMIISSLRDRMLRYEAQDDLRRAEACAEMIRRLPG